jgi:hypothetical protein
MSKETLGVIFFALNPEPYVTLAIGLVFFEVEILLIICFSFITVLRKH